MYRVVFMGTPQFAVPALESIQNQKQYNIVGVYTQPDRPIGRGLELNASPVKKKAIQLGLPVYQPLKLVLPGEYERLQSLAPDFIVVVAYGQILKRNVLELPRLGCLNIHSSLLPRWRGAAPIHWAILNGDSETGVTIMKMAEKLDAGDILLQSAVPIREDDTTGTIHDRLAVLGADLILKTLEGLTKGTLQGFAQDAEKVTYAAKLTKEMEWLDPNQSADELHRRVRALNPWPGTSLRLDQRLKIKKSQVHQNIQGPLGQIFERSGMILLGTSKGSLELKSFQWEGKKEVDSEGFLNGLKGRGQNLPLKVL